MPDVEKGEALLDSRGRKFSKGAVRMARGSLGRMTRIDFFWSWLKEA